MKKYLIIANSVDLVRIAPESVVYIASDGNYSTLVQADGEVRMLSFQYLFYMISANISASFSLDICLSA